MLVEENHRYLLSIDTLQIGFENLSKNVKMLKSGSQLEDILKEGRSPTNRIRLGFSKTHQASTSNTVFVKASGNSDTDTESKISLINHQNKRKCWVCHFCGRLGHIRPFCFQLYGFPTRFRTDSRTKNKAVWKKNQTNILNFYV